MPLPATSGQFRTRFEDMEIGDYIAFKAVGTSGVPATISEIGASLEVAQANEIPVGGSIAPNGYAYAIKTDKGLCVTDRPIQHSVSWDALNGAKLIQGRMQLTNIVEEIIPTDPVNAFSSSINQNKPPSGSFDKLASGSGGWTNNTIGSYVGCMLPTPDIVNGYSIVGDPEGGYIYMITGWVFQGSIDNVQYDDLHTVNGFSWRGGKKYFVFNNINSVPYKYYRIKHVTGGAASTIMFGSEIEFYRTLKLNNTLICSLTGGNAYLGIDGKSSLTDQNLGAFPANNEWDKYIVNSTLGGKIAAGDDNVWHWNNLQYGSYCQDTYASINSGRVTRGGTSGLKYMIYGATANPYNTIGFRPVFQFLELDSKATNLFY